MTRAVTAFRVVATFATFAATALASQGAAAQTPPFVGKWASQAPQCRLGQQSENAPMIIRRDGYDQHETHCKFKSVRPQMPAYAIKAQCEVEGDMQDVDLVFQVAGNRLTIRDEAGARVLQKCP
jgi:hypothetical protein